MKNFTLSMKNLIKQFSVISMLCLSFNCYAQEDTPFLRQVYIPDGPVCKLPPGEYTGLTSKIRNQEVLDKMRGGSTPCSNFVVNYTGFTPEAQTAFEYAVELWSYSIESSVNIRIDANFAPLDPNVIGQAGPSSYLTVNTIIAPEALPNVLYPQALVEKLEGSDISFLEETTDISATFSSTFNFYFGLDANPPSNQIDFVTIVLHELGHGLGFTSRRSSDGTTGTLVNGSTLTTIYDQFVDNGSGFPILSFPDPSTDLHDEFTSEDLFCNSPIATTKNNGFKPQLYAPATYSGGSSYAHWDESTYPAGNPFSLMTPFAAQGEGMHNIGGITLGFFEDMGWSICEGALSVDEFSITSVELSPNPFTSSITIKLSNGLNDNYRVSIMDLNGRHILGETKTATDGTITISNLNQLEDALYFVKITNGTNGASITKKIIKS